MPANHVLSFVSVQSPPPVGTITTTVGREPWIRQQRSGIAANPRAEHVGQVGEERAALQAAGDRGREQPLGGGLAALGLAAERELAVDHRPAQGALGPVVGRLHALDLDEGPKRRPDLQQVLGEAPGELVAPAL